MLLTAPDGRLVVMPSSELAIHDDEIRRRSPQGERPDGLPGALVHGTELTEQGWQWLERRGYLGRFFVSAQASSYLPAAFLRRDAVELSRRMSQTSRTAPVLVVCCGAHRLAQDLAEMGYEVDGMDVEEDVVADLAQQREPDLGGEGRASYFVADASNFAWPGRYGGAVCALNGIRYLGTPGRLTRHLRLMALSLLPGAIYALHVSFGAHGSLDQWRTDAGEVVTWEVGNPHDAEVMETVRLGQADGGPQLVDRHVQLVLEVGWFKDALAHAGFEIAGIFDPDWEPSSLNSEGNLWVLARRGGQSS